jgi:hypothetical protein
MPRKSNPQPAEPINKHTGGEPITVTAQQSRYALDAVDAPASKEVRSPTGKKTWQRLYG